MVPKRNKNINIANLQKKLSMIKDCVQDKICLTSLQIQINTKSDAVNYKKIFNCKMIVYLFGNKAN